MLNLPIIVPAIAFLVAIFAALYARRGRRIDDHWLCRKCGYDLTGRPDGVYQCSECGADLLHRRALLRGNRRRRVKTFRAASIIALASLGFLGWQTYSYLWTADLTPYKPNWLLVRDATGSDTDAAVRAIAHLAYRIEHGAVSNADVQTLVLHGLQHQADRTQRWNPEWGKIVELAHDKKLLSADQWQVYREQSVWVRIDFRPRVVRGRRLPIRIQAGIDRAWKEYGAGLAVVFESGELGGVPLPPVDPFVSVGDDPQIYEVSDSRLGVWSRGLAFSTSPVEKAQLPTGPHAINLHLRVVTPISRAKIPPGSHRKVEATAVVQLLDREPPLIAQYQPDPSESLRTSLRNFFSVKVDYANGGLEYSSSGTAAHYENRDDPPARTGPDGWKVTVRVGSLERTLPVDVSYRVLIMVGNDARTLGSFASREGEGRSFEFGIGGVKPVGDKVSVKLVPESDYEARTVELRPIWGEEITFDDLPIERH